MSNSSDKNDSAKKAPSSARERVENEYMENSDESAPIEEANEFDPEESIYELAPFVLPGETMTQEIAPVTFESPLTDSDINKLEKQKSQNSDEDQADTIPPGLAKDEWMDKQISANKSKTDAEKNTNTNSRLSYANQNVNLTADERRMLFEFEQRKKNVKREASRDGVIGSVLAGKYGVIEMLGKGNMAIVYKVKCFEEGVVYAAKTAKNEATQEELTRFQREIITHSKLSHENIVKFKETITLEDGTKFLIMENVQGISLHDVLEIHGPIKQPKNIWNILSQILDALDHAHKRGVIHRDLKSGNVILSKKAKEQMQVKILDFGIAQVDSLDALKITNPGRSVGSPLYMSPEQCQGEQLNQASDIYALGILAYELVTGEVPYKFDSIYEIMRAHCDPSIKPSTLMNKLPDVPYVDHLERIIFKALETEPTLRFESALEFKTVLKDWIDRVSKVQARK